MPTLASVVLFSILLFRGAVLGQQGYNATTSSTSTTGGILPQVPTVESTQSALLGGQLTTQTSTTTDAATTTPAITSNTPVGGLGAQPTTDVVTTASTTSAEGESSTAPSYIAPAEPVTESTASSLSQPELITLSETHAPVTASTATSLDVPATAAATTTPTTTVPSAYPSPVTDSSDTALLTSSTEPSAIFTYAPGTTTEADSATTPQFTYAPTTIEGASSVGTTPAAASSVEFTYAPTSATTSNPGGLVASYINSVVAPSANTDGATASPVLAQSAGTSVSAPVFQYSPSATTEQTAAQTISIGSSAVSFAPVPQSESGDDSSSAAAAFIIGSQTASVGQTLTVDNTPVVVQTSAGVTQVYAANTDSSAVIASVPGSVATSVPTVLTVGLATVSQGSAGAYLLGSSTLTPGGTITQGSGSSATVIGLQTSGGVTQLVYQDASSTASAAVPTVTGAPTIMTVGLATISQDSNGAYVVGSSTLAPGSSIIEGTGSSQTIVALQTADGTTQLIYQDASTTASSALPLITSAPTPMTIGSATVSQDSAGAYMLGSLTLTAGGSITQGSGASETVVALNTEDGSTQLVYQDASTTITSAPSVAASTSVADSSLLVIGGHTYSIGPASLNAGETGMEASSAVSGFVTSGVSGSASGPSATGGPVLSSAACTRGFSGLLVGFVVASLGFVALW